MSAREKIKMQVEAILCNRGYDSHPSDVELWEEMLDEVADDLVSILGLEDWVAGD